MKSIRVLLIFELWVCYRTALRRLTWRPLDFFGQLIFLGWQLRVDTAFAAGNEKRNEMNAGLEYIITYDVEGQLICSFKHYFFKIRLLIFQQLSRRHHVIGLSFVLKLIYGEYNISVVLSLFFFDNILSLLLCRLYFCAQKFTLCQCKKKKGGKPAILAMTQIDNSLLVP
jgi:hypothetical protein